MKYRRLNGLNNGNELSHSSGGFSLKSTCAQSHAPPEGSREGSVPGPSQLLGASWLVVGNSNLLLALFLHVLKLDSCSL